MSRRAILITCCLAIAVGLFIVAQPSLAFDIKEGIVGNLAPECRNSGNCSWCDFVDLFLVLQKVILSLFGGVALIMIVWAGQSFITAAGSQEKVTAARKLITSTLLGVLIVLAGYFLINILVSILVKPADQVQPKAVFSSEWWRAYCPGKAENKFCEQRGPGTDCLIEGIPGKCQGNKCVSACEYKAGYWYQNTFSCTEISNCADQDIRQASGNAAKLVQCTEQNDCTLGKCTGGSTTVVCCKTPPYGPPTP